VLAVGVQRDELDSSDAQTIRDALPPIETGMLGHSHYGCSVAAVCARASMSCFARIAAFFGRELTCRQVRDELVIDPPGDVNLPVA